MFKKAFNLLILGSLPTGGFLFLAENPLKFPKKTPKKHHNFSKNIDVLSENNFKNREECFVWAPNISYFSLKPLFITNFQNYPKNLLIPKRP
jgi:hypothetical protein